MRDPDEEDPKLGPEPKKEAEDVIFPSIVNNSQPLQIHLSMVPVYQNLTYSSSMKIYEISTSVNG